MGEYNFKRPVEDTKSYDRLKPFGKLITKLRFKISYTGTENIPAEGGYIIASNHIHAFDPVIIGLGLGKKQMHFMAKKELFKNPLFGWILTLVNAFPISRGKADMSSLRRAIKIPRKGCILGIFPEGTRSKDGKPHKAKRGIASIASSAKCGVLPVAVYNDSNLKWRSKYTVRYGKFIPYEELGFSNEDSRDNQSEVADKIMAEIVSLWEEGHC